ncbi:MAG: hypothetical protein SW833_16810 [Cyanobacteriota bacterium]|nr:hypothetical protein [Cyanobacteriota bacterium]
MRSKRAKLQTPNDSNSKLSEKTEKENPTDTPDEKAELDPKQFEMLAQLVYLRVREYIELEQENYHNITPSAPPWLDISSYVTVGKMEIELDAEIFGKCRQLETLAREVYRELQWRLKTETESQGYRY